MDPVNGNPQKWAQNCFFMCTYALLAQTRFSVAPISGWMGDNLLKKSTNMTWWNGMDVLYEGKEKIHVDTLFDVLDTYCRVPERPTSAPMRMPVSGIYKIKGVGDVLAGRVEQGVVKPGE